MNDPRPSVHDAEPARTAGRRAFTLVEILATLALVAIILPVAMSGISLALGVADLSRRQTEAASLAETKMAEIVAGQMWQTASQSGDFAPDRPEYRWVAQVTEWQGATQGTMLSTTQSTTQSGALKQLDVQVLWNNKNRERCVTLSTLVYTGTTSTSGTSQ
jgi:prepilin-type N-terminal cleavage/methylation domain-containing protein